MYVCMYFWTESIEQGVNVGSEWSTCVVPTIFLYLILRCHLLKQILSEINFFWSQKKVSCLKQGSKMNGFCLKEGQGLKALAAHPHPNFPSSAPPRMFTTQKRNIYYN